VSRRKIDTGCGHLLSIWHGAGIADAGMADSSTELTIYDNGTLLRGR